MNENMHAFYKKIELEYEVKNHSWNLFSDFGNLSEVDKIYARYTYRIQEVGNPHLLAKYNHFLLHITRNNNYAAKAIDYYQEVLSYYLSIHNKGFNTLYFSDILSEVILLSTKHKINENN